MTAPPSGTPRLSAAERREQLLEAAKLEFAERGYEGGSTERIAQAAGISQPYVFRLYGSKLQLFLAVLDRGYAMTYELFREASDGRSGQDALDAIGTAYMELIRARPERLQCQLAGYAACHVPEVRACVREGYGRVVTLVENVSGASRDEVAAFFAKGMLLTVLTAMGLPSRDAGWGDRLIEGAWYRPPVDETP